MHVGQATHGETHQLLASHRNTFMEQAARQTSESNALSNFLPHVVLVRRCFVVLQNECSMVTAVNLSCGGTIAILIHIIPKSMCQHFLSQEA
eukprot:6481165-Amphidinium_carterae.4